MLKPGLRKPLPRIKLVRVLRRAAAVLAVLCSADADRAAEDCGPELLEEDAHAGHAGAGDADVDFDSAPNAGACIVNWNFVRRVGQEEVRAYRLGLWYFRRRQGCGDELC